MRITLFFKQLSIWATGFKPLSVKRLFLKNCKKMIYQSCDLFVTNGDSFIEAAAPSNICATIVNIIS